MSEEIGDRIRQRRKDLGLTQREFGQLLNVSKSTPANWETGKAFARPALVPKIAEVLKVTEHWLKTGEHVPGAVVRSAGHDLRPDELFLLQTYNQLPEDLRRRSADFLQRVATALEDAELAGRQRAAATPAAKPASAPLEQPANNVIQLHKRLAPPVEHYEPDEQLVAIRRPGAVAAGPGWQQFERTDDEVEVPKRLLKGSAKGTQAIQVRGDSMAPLVPDGALVLTRRRSPQAGELALVQTETDGWVKWFSREGDELVLESENPAYEPIRVPADQVRLLVRVEAILVNGRNS